MSLLSAITRPSTVAFMLASSVPEDCRSNEDYIRSPWNGQPRWSDSMPPHHRGTSSEPKIRVAREVLRDPALDVVGEVPARLADDARRPRCGNGTAIGEILARGERVHRSISICRCLRDSHSLLDIVVAISQSDKG